MNNLSTPLRNIATAMGLLFATTSSAVSHHNDSFVLDSLWNSSEWIAMEPLDTMVVPGVHFPEARKKFAKRKIGMYAMPQFRSYVNIRKSIRSAHAYVCGLGHFEMQIDGKKVGNHFLDAGWTIYDKEALYVDFDITEMLHKGKNRIDVLLGNGFYNIPTERYAKLNISYGQPKLRMVIDVEYTNGKRQIFGTNQKDWKVSRSPITYSSIYGGEDYDARLENSLVWQVPITVDAHSICLKPQRGTEVTQRRRITAKGYRRTDDGKYLYDLGQNFAGIIEIKAKGRAGQCITMMPSETLRRGKINQGPTGSPYYWKYTFRGEPEGETWQPRFSYYGQRYVLVDGAVPPDVDNPGNLPVLQDIEGILTCTAANEVGAFECGDTLLNSIHSLIDWAILSNSQSIFTDCPTREKLGWLEQDYLMQSSILYRYDVLPIYRKMMDDMEASQKENGCIPTIAPCYVDFEDGFADTPEWGSNFIISPWQIYKWYGDSSLIKEHYCAMKRYVSYLCSRADDYILSYGLGDWFDIGPSSPGYAQLTSNSVTATAIFYHNVTLMAKMAQLTGELNDMRIYNDLAHNIRSAYNARFYNPEGYYERNSQTANAISLYTGLVEDENRDKVIQHLVADIENRGHAITAGDIGFRFVIQALHQAGRDDVIYSIAKGDDKPGYAWQLKHGATALTESWQAYDNVSNNHLMLGHLMEWLYAGLGGISQTEESIGWKHVRIEPRLWGIVPYASTSLESPLGTISCKWNCSQDKSVWNMDIIIPEGADAEIHLPTGEVRTVLSGKHHFSHQGKAS
ncbi:MAG: family 78 glycoside hydrolase catalytic domain [Prevotella sp.]